MNGCCGAEVVRVEFPWGAPLDADRVTGAHPSPKLIAAVHAETSTGAESDIAALGAAKEDALLLVDCVTSLGGSPVEIDDWGVDLAYSATQRCLGVPPGLAPVTISSRARQRLVSSPQSWYLDVGLIAGYVGGGTARTYHHTAPVTMIFALHGGLGALLEEGLEASWLRHSACGEQLAVGLAARGMEPFAQEGNRLRQMVTVRPPVGVDESAVRTRLLQEYGIEIGGGVGPLAGDICRVGCMGHTARSSNVARLLEALDEVL